MNFKLLCLPFIGAAIGWLTNLLAVRMLFRPRRPIRLAGIEIVGVLPRRKPEIAEKLGEIIEREFVFHEKIKGVLNSVEFRESVQKALDQKLDNFIRNKLFAINPILLNLIPEDTLDTIKQRLISELAPYIPLLLQDLARNLEDRVDFKELVTQRIAEFDIERFEEIVLRLARRELRHIEILGGVLGFIIGLAQVLIWSLL